MKILVKENNHITFVILFSAHKTEDKTYMRFIVLKVLSWLNGVYYETDYFLNGFIEFSGYANITIEYTGLEEKNLEFKSKEEADNFIEYEKSNEKLNEVTKIIKLLYDLCYNKYFKYDKTIVIEW